MQSRTKTTAVLLTELFGVLAIIFGLWLIFALLCLLWTNALWIAGTLVLLLIGWMIAGAGATG